MEHVIMMHAKDNIAIVMAPSLAVGSEFTVGGYPQGWPDR